MNTRMKTRYCDSLASRISYCKSIVDAYETGNMFIDQCTYDLAVDELKDIVTDLVAINSILYGDENEN